MNKKEFDKAIGIKHEWICNQCSHVENKEREVICWKCGKGEMIYKESK
jgi:hypothetical protein